MDSTSGHQQIMSDQSLETMLACSKAQQQQDQKKPRPQPEQALKCPRCDSTNTKFCYYNNYSLSQPRYFCKSCRRYWTKGGTLRNVPVGGGCRKNKRSSSSSSSSKRGGQDQAFINTNHNNINSNPFSGFPQLSCYDSSNDFALAIAARLQKGQQLGFDDHHDLSILGSTISSTPCDILGLNNNNNNINSATTTTGFLDALRSGFLGSPNNNNNVQNLYYGGYGNNNGDMGEVVDNNGGGDMNMVLPYDQEMKDTSVATTQAVTVTTMKQEICSGGRELLLQSSGDHNSSSNNRVLWGFPWQMNGSDHTNIGEFDSARASCWNNLNSSSWHGLLNSPLM